MAAPSCIAHSVSKQFATQVVNRLSKEQKQKFNITDTSSENDAIITIQALVERYVNAETDPDKKDQMLKNIDGFIADLDKFFSVVKVSEDALEEAKLQYEKFSNLTKEWKTGRLGNFEFEDSREDQELAKQLKTVLLQYSQVVTYMEEVYPNGRTKSISFILQEPEVSESKTAQQKAIDAIASIQAIQSRYIRPEKDATGAKTGRNIWEYNGKKILVESVSHDVDGGADFDSPILSTYIGTHVDSVGRLFFDKNSKLWEDGKLVNDAQLQGIIDTDFKGVFTLAGFKNLINDFAKLEKQLKEKWGDDIQFFSGDLKLFAKQPNKDLWVLGKPDLLVIDASGTVHVLDFKTKKMTDIKGYQQVLNDNWGTNITYGKQVSRYIRLLESYGLKVDHEPYVILADTWYDSSDHGERNYNADGELIEGRKDIYTIDKEGYISIEGVSLGEYAEENPMSRKELLIDDTDKEVLYMEPRLHISIAEDSEGTITYSEELAALRGKEDLPFDSEVSYEQQWAALTENEKAEMQWLFNAKPIVKKAAQDIVTLSKDDIEGNPKLISSQEIQDVAEFMMYRVSRIISDLQKGKSYPEIELSLPNKNGSPSTVFAGKSRADIIRIAGIDALIDLAFNGIAEHYHEDFPTEQEYKEENYDDLVYSFKDADDYQDQKKMNDKAKWLSDHKEQFIMTGYAKLMALENSVVPIKNKSADFNPKTPDVRRKAEDTEAIGEVGDTESVQSFVDLYLDGITDVEAWMLGQRNYSPRASLAQEIKRMFEDIDMVDAKGKKVFDPYGWGFSMPLDSTKAIQTVLDACKNCETIEEMLETLKNLAKNPKNAWVNQIIDTINAPGNKNLKTKFYRHFYKDSLIYSVAQAKFDKKTGKRIIETRVINRKSAFDVITQSLGASYRNGSVGNYTIEGKPFTLVTKDKNGRNVLTPLGNKGTVANQIRKDIHTWQNRLKALYQEGKYKPEGVVDYVAKQIQEPLFEGKSIIQGITEVLNGIGVLVPQEVVLNACLTKIGKGSITSIAGRLLSNAQQALIKLETMNKGEGIPSGLAGNSAFRNYQPILALVADHVQEFVEASSYQDGKTYYSYTNPSRLGHIIRNLKNALENPEKFEKYIQDNFGRYTGWFKSVDGKEWLCDWVRQFVEAKGSDALEHKVELSYLGNQYRDLGALGFQLSILHNYFGSQNDPQDCAWFALPTMSNKPTNEFIRMKKYKDSKEIVDKVLMNTFKQEMNRMADVLYHYVHYNDSVATDKIDLTDKKLEKAGWTREEIEGLKSRINSQSITVNDLIRLQQITSGAKFHFLWYLNGAISEDSTLEFGTRVAERLNILLTPEGDEKQKRLNASNEADTLDLTKKIITERMEQIVESELANMKKIGLFETVTKNIGDKEVKVLKYQEEFAGNLGSGSNGYDNAVKEMENALRKYIWQDIAANINIIQITGGDLAYYGDAVNYQKRIAQIHSPGLKVMHDPDYDDGYLRSVHISDEIVRDEIKANTEVALNEYMEKAGLSGNAREDYKKMISIILDGLTRVESTDGQSYSSPTSIRKKLALQGEWDEEKEKAYQAIIKGDFNINHLGVMLQPRKPFVTSDTAKYSGSTTMELRRVPLQDKNSEYLIILAEALARGAGKRSKLVAICDFMEETAKNNPKQGIDTVHFASVNKVGKSGVIDISAFDKEFAARLQKGEVAEEDYNDLLKEYLLYHTRTYNETRQSAQSQEDYEAIERCVQDGKLKKEETLYNSQYVDTIPLNDYIIQQEVPAHLLEHQQLYGSQIRILGISDITQGTEFDVNGEKMSDKELVKEYKKLHAQNVRESFENLLQELGLDKLFRDGEIRLETIDELPSDERNQVYKNLELLLQTELSKDAKYGLDTRRACVLQYDSDGNVIDFIVPLMEPTQSRRIQELINSIIKKAINKQKISGGPVVQTTAYDRNLHIRFKDKKGNILPTFEEYKGNNEQITIEDYKLYLKTKQAGIAYFECYMPIPNAALERLITNPDGSIMSYNELFNHEENGKKVKGKLPAEVQKAMSEVIGYRIPTEDKYSMIPLKIVGFVPKAAGQVIMMPQEITYLTGSDFDIDKMYIMMKAINIFRTKQEQEEVEALAQKYVNEHLGEPQALTVEQLKKHVRQVMYNAAGIMEGDPMVSWTTGIEKNGRFEAIQKFIDWYRNYLLKASFSIPQYDKDDIPEDKREARDARNNRILDLQWAVLTNEDTASKMLNPGNFNDQKKVGRIIRILKSGIVNPKTGRAWTYEELNGDATHKGLSIEELDSLLESVEEHNTTLPSSKIYFQHQNMQGSQMVGIFANHNVSHAFMSFQKVGIDLQKNPNYDNSFYFDGVLIGDADNPTVLDPQRGFDGRLISKTIASFLAASVDTAKDPVLSDLNVNTFTGSVAMVLARLGFDTAAIGLFLSQPIIIQLSELYFKNSTEGFYAGDTAIEELASTLGMKKKELRDASNLQNDRNEYAMNKENLVTHLNDSDYEGDGDNYQKEVLKCFYRLYQIAHDLADLTFCTKFNSVSNAVGPTIADTMEDLDRVQKFLSPENMEKSVFYIPETDHDPNGFTDPGEVIANDEILNAFYETTVGPDGASAVIFRNFFPHYFAGFQNLVGYFKENFLGGSKLSSKLYNQLLNEYLYYLMTYQDENYQPTIPYSQQDKKELISSLIADFKSILKIEGRRPNVILDQGLGNNCLRVRDADEFIAIDTLVFNSSQLDAEGQQKIKNAWSDLITMDDPNLSEEDNERIRRFGVDLFFYNLMRNGFTFSPKTLMALASVVVKYNATYAKGFQNYILGLRNLKDIDGFLMNGSDDIHAIRRFCSQFIRNHANNKQLVPTIDWQDSTLISVDSKTGDIEFGAPIEEEYKLSRIMVGEGNPRTFITVIKKNNNSLTQELYELVEVADEKQFTESGMTKVRYRKVNRLGLTNNFIEYDANSDLEQSFFEAIQNASADDMDAELLSEGHSKDETDKALGNTSPENDGSETAFWNSNVLPILMSLKGPQSGKEGRDYRKKLRQAMREADDSSELAKAFNEMLNAKESQRQGLMDKINEIFKKQDKC